MALFSVILLVAIESDLTNSKGISKIELAKWVRKCVQMGHLCFAAVAIPAFKTMKHENLFPSIRRREMLLCFEQLN